jgi:putative acetyltransferase
MISFKRTNSHDQHFKHLVALLDNELSDIDGSDHSFYSQYNKIDMIKHAIVCYENDVPVGCGAFKQFEGDTAEIKRMFVMSHLRGKGIGRSILHEFETWAAELKYKHCILETGKRQPDAIKLYDKAGYRKIANYGQYKNVENSVCMQKAIYSL